MQLVLVLTCQLFGCAESIPVNTTYILSTRADSDDSRKGPGLFSLSARHYAHCAKTGPKSKNWQAHKQAMSQVACEALDCSCGITYQIYLVRAARPHEGTKKWTTGRPTSPHNRMRHKGSPHETQV